MSFTLHPQLIADTDLIYEFPLCLALLHKEEIGPWIILVPKKENLREFHHLSMADQQAFLYESQAVCQSLETLFQPTKLNLGALGNLVPQLHIHHIVRFEHDCAWPNPIWGNTPGILRSPEATQALILQLKQAFEKHDILHH